MCQPDKYIHTAVIKSLTKGSVDSLYANFSLPLLLPAFKHVSLSILPKCEGIKQEEEIR